MEIEQGILLSSYEIPKGEDKNTFSYDSMKNVDYSKLEKNLKNLLQHFIMKRTESGKVAAQASSLR